MAHQPLAISASLDQLLILSDDGQSYTTQFTIEADSTALAIDLPGSVVPEVIRVLGNNRQETTAAELTLQDAVLLLRYEHQYNAEISISHQLQDRVFTLSMPAVNAIKTPQDLDAISILWIFPPEFTINSWNSDDSQASWSLDNNQLRFDSSAEIPANVTIIYTQPAASRADLDSDGVPDDIDDCLSSAAQVLVNDKGCALDFDNDGVPNSFDQCPQSQANTPVDAEGCEPDQDKDGIADSKDRCSATPAFAATDPDGCAIDTDSDSVPDYRDTCPTQQFVKRIESVDWWGCQSSGPLQLTEISFKTGSSNLDKKARDILDKIALAMNFHRDSRFDVAAHTDWSGTPENNQALSLRRATVVRQYLLLKGVEPRRLKAQGYGESRPIANNNTLYGRQRNRRIEIIRTPD